MSTLINKTVVEPQDIEAARKSHSFTAWGDVFIDGTIFQMTKVGCVRIVEVDYQDGKTTEKKSSNPIVVFETTKGILYPSRLVKNYVRNSDKHPLFAQGGFALAARALQRKLGNVDNGTFADEFFKLYSKYKIKVIKSPMEELFNPYQNTTKWSQIANFVFVSADNTLLPNDTPIAEELTMDISSFVPVPKATKK